MTREKNVAPQDANSLFLSAVTEMEAAHMLWRKKQYQQFVTVLQGSAACLARAVLLARGDVATGEQPRTELIRTLNESNDPLGPVLKNISDVLVLDANTNDNRDAIKAIYREYQNTLIEARKVLMRDLHYNEKRQKKLQQLFFTSTGLKQIFAVVLPLIVFLSLPLAFYHYVDPIDNFELDGQVFWKSKPKVPFTANDSRRFAVIADNQNREYTLSLDSPVNIFLLRLDPVNAIGLTDIEIEEISLLGADNVLLRQLIFDSSMYWSCDHCVSLENDRSTYRMRPSSNDPYLTSSAIDQEGVSKIIIKMRAVSRKTFWEWVLAINKNMEF